MVLGGQGRPAVTRAFAGRDQDPVTWKLIELTAPGGPLAGAIGAGRLPPGYWRCWGERTLSRPMVLPEGEVETAALDTLALFDLLAHAPERLFNGDLRAYGAALGIDERRIDLLRRFPVPGRIRYGRADFYHDGEGLRLLEFNVASDLGGVDRCVYPQSLLALPALQELAAETGLRYVHTGRLLADDLRKAAGTRHDPVVAVVCAPGGLRRFGHLLEAFAEMMRGLGTDLRLTEGPRLVSSRGRVSLDGVPLDIVLRFFTIDDVIDGGAGEPDGVAPWARPLLRAAIDGSLLLWTALDSTLLSNKGALALLSAPAAPLTAGERALVDRLMPSTRILQRGEEEQYADRRRWVIKPLRDYGGGGVLPGWQVSDEEWRCELRARAGQGHLVQERVLPRSEPVLDPATGELTDWIATWGLFVTPSGYAGADVRAAPAAFSGVVNYGTNPLTRTTGVYTHSR